MDEELIQEFLTESWENLGQLDTEIVELEKHPDNAELLASIFRTIHTIKGTCGFIGLTKLGEVAHSTENVLGQMREGNLAVTADVISMVLEGVDRIKSLLEALEQTGEEPDLDNSELIQRLDTLAQNGTTPTEAPAAPAETAQQESPVPAESIPAETSAGSPQTPQSSPTEGAEAASVPSAAVPSADSPEATEAPVSGSPAEESGSATTAQPGLPAAEESVSAEKSPSVAAASASASQSPASPAAATAAAQKTSEPKKDSAGESRDESGRKSISDLSIRVHVDVLDSLMNLVGELVLTRNQLIQLARGDEESKYAAPVAHLNRITTDLQDGVMKTRMQPIGNAWNKLPRLVRDLSQATGKSIELQMSGEDTELDRTVLDAIRDPLTHMVRNSADHGIEPPEQRRAAGKPETGTIRLTAYHEGGHVIICIDDDGAGINVAKVREKAIRLGLISAADAEQMSDAELANLVFAPGFSTAETVSSVSGRGVGMDVVRTQIAKIGGTIDLSFRPGEGTSVKIKIPLTLAIISALVVETGSQSFTIPQLGVVELVRLTPEERLQIETIHDREVLRLRDRLLPLVYLDEVLGLQVDEKEREEGDVNIVVVQAGEERIGLVVTQVFDTEEIVVKPVGSLLKDIDVYQGTTILGDGRVIMILDIAGITAATSNQKLGSTKESGSEAENTEHSDYTSLLLFDAGGHSKMAVPLSLVSRLEEIPRDRIEQVGDRLVVQYRGDLLPLLPIQGTWNLEELADPQPVIVFTEGANSMGLMVHQILDIHEERFALSMQSKRPGVLGTAIVNGSAMEVVDTQHYVLQANPEWFVRRDGRLRARVLLVDDSPFLRQLAETALEAEGHTVVGVEDVAHATSLLQHGEQFDVIVSDLDMPGTGGLEFARWLRGRTATAQTPLIALSGLTDEPHKKQAAEAGFDRFLTKFDAHQLCATITELMSRHLLGTGVPA